MQKFLVDAANDHFICDCALCYRKSSKSHRVYKKLSCKFDNPARVGVHTSTNAAIDDGPLDLLERTLPEDDKVSRR